MIALRFLFNNYCNTIVDQNNPNYYYTSPSDIINTL
jgi:hypothetical protein